MSERNQRNNERFSIGLPIRLVVSKEAEPEIIESVTQNISASGALVQSSEPIPIGTEVELDLIIPLEDLRQMSGKKARIKISGSVVRLDPQCVAIKFGEQYKVLPVPE